MDVASQPQKILILSANPQNTSRLRLDKEIREIKQELKRARQRDLFSIESAEAAHYRDLYQAILDHKPQIIHFSGHGTGEDGLVFEDEAGQPKLVDDGALAGLFRIFSAELNLKCVVLNACYSEVQAKAIAQYVDYVIGMNKAIGDKAAIEFSVGFYTALGDGRDVNFAYELGCVAIQLAGISEHLTPELLSKQSIYKAKPQNQKANTTNSADSANPDDLLSSDCGVDYGLLRDLVDAEEWREANQETIRIICQISKRYRIDEVTSEDIEKLPCKDLCSIEQLWLKSSNKRFGFTVQKQIYLEERENYVKLANRVGWRNNFGWGNDFDSEFSPYIHGNNPSPKGCWPSIWNSKNDLHRRKALFSRLNMCSIK